ncbi:L-fuculokinase [Photorhabdus australis subsp. thailandensis]|uniref:L-fuculokinase n=1 Tax=Photorhabdus australis subsp. thailandensis TaxID=2805096 RepID=A0A1C0U7G1_9GAMM|nr:L-fuculokinase [Photorhabdus australis]OCQ53825.1 L-fuculokinase [Photorhabdus australis subsp. thailandensis]
MTQDVILVLDCGATNVRVIAIDPQGNVIAKESTLNTSEPDKANPHWHIWSLDAILERLASCCRVIIPELSGYKIRAVTVTTFGVDGTLVNAKGDLLYPIISWKCPRTIPIVENITHYFPAEKLQTISGVGQFNFNTLYKLIWLKENYPTLLNQAHAWLFISSLINHRLTDVMSTDRTMAGTSQLLNIHHDQFSEEILDAISISARLFPELVSAGEQIGNLTSKAARKLNLPSGIPVISSGHDTQFALFGSGADLHQPVLSSGTWEILMVRTPYVNTHILPYYTGSTCELDARKGFFNPGLQWLASGVLEWIRRLFWQDIPPSEAYRQMIHEALSVPPGSNNLRMNCHLLTSRAGWRGTTLNTERRHFYRAALEALGYQLKQNLSLLEKISGFHSKELVLVGGGSRNHLWNQIKADIINMPIKVLNEAETTVLGASFFAWFGAGYYESSEKAREQFSYHYELHIPGEHQKTYDSLAQDFIKEIPL